jgi:DNA-binding MarR family transcriptional regulator
VKSVQGGGGFSSGHRWGILGGRQGLIEKKWIRVAVDTHDRRLTLLTETPKGFSVWEECMQAFNQSSSELISILSEHEQVNAIRFLKKLEKAFKRK